MPPNTAKAEKRRRQKLRKEKEERQRQQREERPVRVAVSAAEPKATPEGTAEGERSSEVPVLGGAGLEADRVPSPSEAPAKAGQLPKAGAGTEVSAEPPPRAKNPPPRPKFQAAVKKLEAGDASGAELLLDGALEEATTAGQRGDVLMLWGQLPTTPADAAVGHYTRAIEAYEAEVREAGFDFEAIMSSMTGQIGQLLPAVSASTGFGRAVLGCLGLANCHSLRAQAQVGHGDLQRAREDALKAIEVFRKAGDSKGVATASVSLAMALADGAPENAMQLLAEASSLFKSLGEKRLGAQALVLHGRLVQAQAHKQTGGGGDGAGGLPTGPDSDDEEDMALGEMD